MTELMRNLFRKIFQSKDKIFVPSELCPIRENQVWSVKGSVCPDIALQAKIVSCQDGWVKYQSGDGNDVVTITEFTFRLCYEMKDEA